MRVREGFVRAAAASVVLAALDAQGASFVENVGQFAPEARFAARSAGVAIFLTETGAVVDRLVPAAGIPGAGEPQRSRDARAEQTYARLGHALRYAGGATASRCQGLDPSPVRLRYLGVGSGATAVEPRSFERVVCRDVWPGVDVVWAVADDGTIEHEIVASGGADISRVDLVWDGPPPAPPAPPSSDLDGLDWSTFLGGERDEEIHAVALDSSGRPVVVGTTRSLEFPTSLGVVQPAYAGSFDLFVARLTADASAIEWSTYLGASNDDRGWALRLDDADRVAGRRTRPRPVIAGVTASTSFPVTPSAFDTTHNGHYDACVAKLAADGSALVWSTFLGGAGLEFDVSGLALDASGRPVICGSTESADFPTTPGAHDETLGGLRDGFVTKLAADGTSLVWSTLLGGSAADAAEDLALAAGDLPVVVGRTASADFPVTSGAFQTTHGGTATQDAFVTRLSADGTSVVSSTYLGGSANDEGYGIAVGPDDSATICGMTLSTDLPTTPRALYPSFRGAGDGFVARLSPDATSLVFGTYLGGSAGDRALDVATDWTGQPVVTGWTCAANFPVERGFDATYNGACDGFVVRLDARARRVDYGTFLGGYDDDAGLTVVLEPLGRPIVAGRTQSPDFPVGTAAAQSAHGSPELWEDGFLAQVVPATFCTTIAADGRLHIGKAPHPACAPGPPPAQAIDIIEGRLEAVDAATLGEVWPIRCAVAEPVLSTGTRPAPGFALFQLARFTGGAYTDGGGPTLVGARVAASGDCP